MSEKPIRFVPKPLLSVTEFGDMKCDQCGAPLADDKRAGYRFEDVDMGDYIERRQTDDLCGKCMASPRSDP